MCYEFEGWFSRRKLTEKLQQKIEAVRKMRARTEPGHDPKPAPAPVATQKSKETVGA